jgi:1-phosphofructokinase
MLRDNGCRTVLDTSGEALRFGMMAKPDIVKPNRDEMAYIDRSTYNGLLVNSLGAEGVRFIRAGQELYIPNLPVAVNSPAGAGDCMTGALAYAFSRELGFEETAVLAAAAANAAVTMPGTQCPPFELIEKCRQEINLYISKHT